MTLLYKYRFLAVFIVIANILFLAANIPFLNRQMKTPAGYYSPWIHWNPMDYTEYIAFIREGNRGEWLIKPLYTSEGGSGTIIYIYYTLLGKLSKIVGLTPVAAYHIARFVQMEIYTVLIYSVGLMYLSPVLAAVAGVIGLVSGPPGAFLTFTFFNMDKKMPVGWETISPWLRLDSPPHHQAGYIFLFISIILLVKLIRTGNIKYLAASWAFACFTGIVYPAPVLVVLTVLPAVSVIMILKSYINNQKIYYKYISYLIFVAGGALLGLSIIRGEIAKGFPWDQVVVWESALWKGHTDFLKTLPLTGGMLLFLSVFEAIRILLTKQAIDKLILASWALLPYLMIPVIGYLPIASFRLLHLANFVPMAILAVIVLKKSIFPIPVRVLFILIYLSNIIPAGRLTYDFVRWFHEDLRPGYAISLPDYEALNFLGKNGLNHSVILSDVGISLMIPAFIPMITFAGHELRTNRYWDKASLVDNFYSGRMSGDIYGDFIKPNKIKYILLGQSEKRKGGDILSFGLPLTEIFRNRDSIIYEVENL